jgi:hypothetical protein
MPDRFSYCHRDELLKQLTVMAALLLLSASPGFAANWKQSLEESLKAEYRPTKIGIRALQFDYNRITEPGAVLVVRIPGIYADIAETKQAIIKTKIVNGEAVQQKGVLASLTFTKQSRQLNVNDHVYVTQVSVKDDGIQFELLTQEPSSVVVDGNTVQSRYRSEVVFPFGRDELPNLKFADVKRVIDPVLATNDVANAAQTKTIQLGMSTDDVKRILGNPEKIVDLGEKKIYIYKDMKVVFKDSQVADVL